ncbi:MAG TPA: NFACT family protein [bacterium]|nr:NFACT family protein [bacterium]
MTPTLIQILTRELRESLLQSRLSHISQSAPETVELAFYHPDRPTLYLTLALLPLKPLLFAGTEKRTALSKPPNFCRSLRKHLEYAQLTAVESEPGERLIHFVLKAAEGSFRIVFEGIPKYPNVILVGPDNLIISALRYKSEVERPVMPQALYNPPPHGPSYLNSINEHGAWPASSSKPASHTEGGPPQSMEKPNLWKLGEPELKSLWEKAGRPPLASWLKNDLRGADTELAAYLGHFGDKSFSQWERVRKEILEEGWKRFTLFPGPPPSMKVFPLQPETENGLLPYTSASKALGRLFQLETQYRDQLSARTKLESEVTRAIKHEKRIMEKLKKDRAEAEKSDQYQWWGELLMAQLHKVKLHLSEVTLEDVVRGGPDPKLIPLDPGITPLQNAQRYFKKAQKGSRGLALVEQREKEIQDRLNQLKSAQRSLPALRDAVEIRKAFQDLFPKKKEPQGKPKKEAEPKVPTPNIFREKLGKGFELCAGTSAAANEYVTFQLAQPADLWFHVRDFPGSHVILRRLQRDAKMTEELILAAARVAAGRSKAQPGEKVSVSYTEKKNVKRIPGAPMGMVSLTNEKSLLVQVPPPGAVS